MMQQFWSTLLSAESPHFDHCEGASLKPPEIRPSSGSLSHFYAFRLTKGQREESFSRNAHTTMSGAGDSGIAVGLKAGFIVTKRAKSARPSQRKGVRNICGDYVPT